MTAGINSSMRIKSEITTRPLDGGEVRVGVGCMVMVAVMAVLLLLLIFTSYATHQYNPKHLIEVI